VRVSLQVAIMKVLASYPDGRASVAAMKSDLAILAGAGPAWSMRLKRLAARAPDLDIFSQGLVFRDASGWQLTTAGRDALRVMEAKERAVGEPTPAAPVPAAAPKLVVVASAFPRELHASPPATMVGISQRRRLARRAL
jgi:hypothetical protein